MQTPQGLDAQHGGELFPIDESRRLRANPASRNSGEAGADRTGVEILATGVHVAGQRRICSPYGMITSAMEARYMTNDLTDWHELLARVNGQLCAGSNE